MEINTTRVRSYAFLGKIFLIEMNKDGVNSYLHGRFSGKHAVIFAFLFVLQFFPLTAMSQEDIKIGQRLNAVLSGSNKIYDAGPRFQMKINTHYLGNATFVL